MTRGGGESGAGKPGRAKGWPRQLALFEGLLEALRGKAAAPRQRRAIASAVPNPAAKGTTSPRAAVLPAAAVPAAAVQATAPSVAPTAVGRPRRRGRLETRGRCCDLAELAVEINARYFDGELATSITWARRRPQRRRRRRTRRITLQLGSYRADLDLVRIHPALDQPWVPRYVLESVIYHELLHAALPATIQNGRRRVHTPEFRRRERLDPHLDRAQAWIQANLRRLTIEGSS